MHTQTSQQQLVRNVSPSTINKSHPTKRSLRNKCSRKNCENVCLNIGQRFLRGDRRRRYRYCDFCMPTEIAPDTLKNYLCEACQQTQRGRHFMEPPESLAKFGDIIKSHILDPSPLKGKSLEIYTLFHLEGHDLEIKEIQKSLKCRSEDVILRHLQNLLSLDLVVEVGKQKYSLKTKL